MITIIAEKPSVAKDIAAYLNCKEKGDGFLKSDKYYVTWAYGHLLELKSFEELGYEGQWKLESLPFIPREYEIKLKDDSGVRKQFSTIKSLLNESDEVICATDAGREGELIFRYIYHYSKTKIPIKRLWLRSLTNEAISKAFNNLEPGEKYNNLFYSAVSRNQADYLVGLNATIALTSKNNIGSLLSLGRVQTPTLALICSRYLDNINFVPEPYYTLTAKLFKDIEFKALSIDKWKVKEEASLVYNTIQNSSEALITKIEKKETKEAPPLLYDLAGLQKDANKIFSFSANETLDLAQSLYEKKVITYPRTGSSYIGEDIFSEIPSLIEKIITFPNFSKFKDSVNYPLTKRSVNDDKVTDHHAILVTGNLTTGLSENENRLFELITTRVLQSFSPHCIKDVTTVESLIENISFKSSGTIIRNLGWRVFTNKDETKENSLLPDLNENTIVKINSISFNELFTTPKAIHTDASLVEAMETCGKDVDDEELKSALKENGIGTPATRAGIIETLIKRNYVNREKKLLVPTKVGLQIYEIVKDLDISQVELTGTWENKLLNIEKGKYDKDLFESEIQQYTKKLINSIIVSEKTIKKESFGTCPDCKGNLFENSKAIYCENSKQEKCKFPVIFKVVSNKQLSSTVISQLLNNKKTDLIKGFKNGEGRSFDAKLKIEDNKIIFDFETESIGKCPKCKKHDLAESSKSYYCPGYKDNTCDFSIWKEISNKKLSKSIINDLLKNSITSEIKGFKSKNNTDFTAKLTFDEKFKVVFSFK